MLSQTPARAVMAQFTPSRRSLTNKSPKKPAPTPTAGPQAPKRPRLARIMGWFFRNYQMMADAIRQTKCNNRRSRQRLPTGDHCAGFHGCFID